MICAERLRVAVQDYPWSYRKATISLGVATWTPAMTNKAMMLDAADGALFTAKTMGRNRIGCHDRNVRPPMVA
jgi:PleD family two-component response regulator